VRTPLEPNGTTGWIARNAVDELRTTQRALVVDTQGLSATLLRDGEVLWSAPIATGNADWPTPTGDFYVRRPELIPGRVSAGCIRMTNEDVLALRPLLGVGAPVTIV
jgi:lipoprotein-anchoring transpeptidase ErfK/SrfK